MMLAKHTFVMQRRRRIKLLPPKRRIDVKRGNLSTDAALNCNENHQS